MTKHEPPFDLINIEPVFIFGRDETATDTNGLIRGANGVLLRPLIGQHSETPYAGIPVHVDDVAMMHVRSLDRKIPGNTDYIATSHPLGGIEWATAFDIVKKHYPKECAEGVFQADTEKRPRSTRILVDNSRAENIFGFTFKSFEEQVLSVAGQYIEFVSKA